ncbi:helix-turn-helix domain-containing protein, partial [Streptomyces sp. NPDC002130]|uniref:helix-turn-helix domain-containing protein n=1 Tax=Streptomyces sp. NPDC002130 TaxID=3155568 RepID=UPI00333468AF
MTEVLREDTSARRKIIEAAREVFVDPGYAAATIKQLAAAAGVSVQSVYFVRRWPGSRVPARRTATKSW